MDLRAAEQTIRSSLSRMDGLYGRPVFDEWAILSASTPQRGVLAYDGARKDEFTQSLVPDAAPLRAITAGRAFATGDFEFAPDADGTRYDSCVKIGASAYLVCNNLEKNMEEIRLDPRWLKAQAVFFELCEKFRADPLR